MFDLDSFRELFKTKPNTWSGVGENGEKIAKETAKANGGVTLIIYFYALFIEVTE